MTNCAVCGGPAELWRRIDGYDYFDCRVCESIAIDAASVALVDEGNFPRHYDPAYWAEEGVAARGRSWGASLARVAETILYCRRPIERFVDIGSGPGHLLDSLATYLPAAKERFFAVEKFPPEVHTAHPGYLIGDLADTEGVFDAGVCIEVVEHLTPRMFTRLIQALAQKSRPGSLFFFNTAAPSYVKQVDEAYMDPLRRGHIISWGLPALRNLFEPHGFTVQEVKGKNFAFAVEFESSDPMSLPNRIWYPVPENRALLNDPEMGEVMFILGLESVRAYL